jgi:hypothetical protein
MKKLEHEHALKMANCAHIRDIHIDYAKKLYRTEDKRLIAKIKVRLHGQQHDGLANR